MRQIDYLLTAGFSPGYLRKIGVNFFVAAMIMGLIMTLGLLRPNGPRIFVAIIFLAFGLICFVISNLKWKRHRKHWQMIGEPETTPQEMKRSGRLFAQFGLVILIFVVFKMLLLKVYPDAYDLTGIVIPFLICVYLFLKARRRRRRR